MTKNNTGTTNNYCYNINGYWFAVRRNNNNGWKAVSYKEKFISTDNYIVNVVDGYKTKKDALIGLLERLETAPLGFFHNIF